MTRPLTIPILGNTSDLEAALAKAGVVAEDASKKITGSFRSAGLAAADEAKRIGASVDEQAAAAGRAAVAFTEMSAKITVAQKNAGKAAATAAGQVGASVDEQRAAYVRAIATQSEYEASVARAADAAKTAAAEQVAASRAAADAAKKAAAEQTAAFEGAQKKLSGLGKWTLGGGAAIAGFSVKGAMDLQRQMTQLQTQAGATQKQVQQMTSAAVNMAPGLATGPSALADSLYHAFSATKNQTQALGIMSAAAKEAKISGADLTDTTTALTAAVFSNIQGAQNYSQAMGLLNATVGAGNMKFQDLNEALGGPMLATVKGYGLSLKDVGAALATMGDLNIPGADAATQLRMAVQYMAKPAATAGPLLEKLGLNTHSFADAMANGGLLPALQLLHDRMDKLGISGNQMAQVIGDLFTKKGASGIDIMENSLDRLKSKYQQVGQGASRQNAAWNATQKTLAFQMDQLKATVQSLGDKFGLYLIPKLEAAGTAIQSVIGWLGKHKVAAQDLAEVIGGVLATAITVFAYTKAVAFIGATKDMASGIGNLVGRLTGATPQIAATGSAAAEAAPKVVAVGTSAAEAEGGVAGFGAAAATAGPEVATLGADAEVATPAIAGMTAVLGPLALALGAVALAGAHVNKAMSSNQWNLMLKFGQANGMSTKQIEQYALQHGVTPPAGAKFTLPGAAGSNFTGTYAAPMGVRGSTGGVWTGENGQVTSASFAASLLSRLGAPTNATNIDALVGWITREGNDPFVDKYNPLDTTIGGFGGKSTNSAGVKSFGNWGQGLAATLATLKGSNFQAIVAALKAGHGLSGAGVGGELAAWSGGGYSSAAPAKLSTKQLDALLNSTGTKAAATSAIPVAVATMLQTALSLQGANYTWGGGHSGWDPVAELKKIGVDCSGFVSAVLHSGGVNLRGPQTTEGLASSLQKGRGQYYTVWDRHTGAQNQQHTLIDILGKWFESGGKASPGGVSQITSKQAAQELAGGGFDPYHAAVSGPMATLKQLKAMGISNTTAESLSSAAANFNQTLTSIVQAVTKAADSLIQKYGNLEQSGTVRTLTSGLGVNTTTRVSNRVPGQWGLSFANDPTTRALPLSSMLNALFGQLNSGTGNRPTIGQIDQTGNGFVTQASGRSSQGQAFNQLVSNLEATGQKQLADRLIAAHKAAMATLTQELYAEQTLKDGEILTLTATQLKDQTTLIANSAADQLDVVKAQYQLQNDIAQGQLTYVRDMTQTVTDQFSGMVQSVQDQTTRMADAASAVVTGITDNTQIQVDTFGERGLYGLNLVAQKLQVQLDIQKASDDQKIAAAQQNLDAVTATQHAATQTAQLNLDQVTTAQDQLAAQAQQAADTVAVHQAIRLAAAQAQVDALTLHEDVSVVGPAQTAVDLGATLPKAQQDVLNAQLRKAQGIAGVAENGNTVGGGQWFQKIQDSVNAFDAAASQSATAASAAAQAQIGAANLTLQQVTGTASYQIAVAQQGLQGAQSGASLAEAPLQSGVSITQAEAQTQFAGSGLVQNFYGVPMDNATAIGDTAAWGARTSMQVPI